MDFSEVALRMARSLAAERRVEVDWIEADVVAWTPPARAYDLVCVLYLQLPASARRTDVSSPLLQPMNVRSISGQRRPEIGALCPAAVCE